MENKVKSQLLIVNCLNKNMGLPGHRRTRSHKKRRASHFALGKINFSLCPKCKKPVLPHHVCGFCGFYSGKEVLKMKAPKKKKEAK